MSDPAMKSALKRERRAELLVTEAEPAMRLMAEAIGEMQKEVGKCLGFTLEDEDGAVEAALNQGETALARYHEVRKKIAEIS